MSYDTDVFVLLLYHYQAQNLLLPVEMESPIKERAVIDIRQKVQRHSEIVPDVIKPRREKTGFLNMRKQRRRSDSR